MSGPTAHTGYAFVGFENLHNDIYPAISAAQTPSLKQPGKVVLVTGASRGIGRAIAIQYAHAGVTAIILVARSAGLLEEVKKEIEGIDKGIKVTVKAVDVTSEEAVKGLKEDVVKEEGRLDVLVNVSFCSLLLFPLSVHERDGDRDAHNNRRVHVLAQSLDNQIRGCADLSDAIECRSWRELGPNRRDGTQ